MGAPPPTAGGLYTSTRPQTNLSQQLLSCTSSVNIIPSLRSSYITDYEKTYKTLNFGVTGRRGNFENRALEDAKKYRAQTLKSFDDTSKLLSTVRTPINADVCSLHSTIDVSSFSALISNIAGLSISKINLLRFQNICRSAQDRHEFYKNSM